MKERGREKRTMCERGEERERERESPLAPTSIPEEDNEHYRLYITMTVFNTIGTPHTSLERGGIIRGRGEKCSW